MAEPAAWGVLGRLTWGTVKNWLPQRVLRWAWSNQEILNSIHAVHFEQSPRFYVRPEREPPALEYIGLNLFNFTPFKLSLVGADLRVYVDSYEWIVQRERLPSEVLMAPHARSGYQFKHALSDSQARKLRERTDPFVAVRVGGHLVLRSVVGELRKEIHSDIVALIDR